MKLYALSIKKPSSRQSSRESKLPPIESEKFEDLKAMEMKHAEDIKAVGSIRNQFKIDQVLQIKSSM